MKLDQVGNQIWDQAVSISHQVPTQIRDQIRDQIFGLDWHQVYDQAYFQVWHQVYEKVLRRETWNPDAIAEERVVTSET
jgi:hypothetical protein